MIEKLYAMKERLLKKKVVPVFAHLTIQDYNELCHETGIKPEWIIGLEIHLNSKTYVE